MKQCTACGQVKALSEFYECRTENRILRRCKECCQAKMRIWRNQNTERARLSNRTWRSKNTLRHRETSRRRYAAVRRAVISHYSHGLNQCACCAESVPEFLTIDHMSGGGAAHRKVLRCAGKSFVVWLKRQGLPLGYQVLCFNCNGAKGLRNGSGVCPHEAGRSAAMAGGL